MLNKKEQAWVKKLQKVIDECPKSLSDRVESYTIGDNVITIFDEGKYKDFVKQQELDIPRGVEMSNSEETRIYFPFCVSSGAG